jgi:dihydroxy-acid dehydratase
MTEELGVMATSDKQRGAAFFAEPGVAGFTHRAFAKSMGFDDEDLARPVIGICNTYSELNNCHQNFRELAEAVKRGVWQAGGLPLEFPTISLGEVFLSPSSMIQRNLAAMDTEEMIRAQPLDGVVLLASCDKTTPAALMGAISADLPAIMLSGGPMLDGHFRGQRLGACTDCRRMTAEHDAGTMSNEDYRQVENHVARSAGHCMVMGTASTMNSLVEALGMALPGNAAIPAVDSRRMHLAQAVGRRIVAVAREDLRPSRILTAESFDNAISVLMAIGGSTNAVIHLCAIAGRAGIDLPLSRFDEISRRTPMIANMRPIGEHQMEALHEAGGVPAIMRELLPFLHGDCLTVTGRTVAQNVESARIAVPDVIRTVHEPLRPEGGLAILFGNLAADGAVIKHGAASPELLRHRGRAVVFRNIEDLRARIDTEELDVNADDVLVLQNVGPIGGPGMPEVGNFPIPRKLLRAGVRDMVRISDARMSGTACGTVVLHVSPETAVGGTLAHVRDGDLIELDVEQRRLHLDVADDELARRRSEWTPPPPAYRRGYGRLFLDNVESASTGCDFEFLHGSDPVHTSRQPKF